MNKLKYVEDVRIGDVVIEKGETLTIVDTFSVNGEGRGFITKDEKGKEVKIEKTCGTYMTIVNE